MGEDGRVFLRGITSETYGLGEQRRRQLAVNRVRNDDVVVDDASVAHSGDSAESRTWWRIGPGDDPDFLTQSVQVHFVELSPGGSNHGHGHQNEAIFYILEGTGYEIHDGERYDWEAGDLVVVHDDSVHRHFNASSTERALCIVFKAKSLWMYLGLLQQGRSAPFEETGYGPRRDWSSLWTEGVAERKKVVKPADTHWVETLDGRVRVITSRDQTDVRAFSVDLYEQEIAPRERSTAHLHMADEVLYVLSGSGYSLHWQVEAEIAERYYARIADRPSRWELKAGATVYVPQNTVHEFVNTSASDPLRMLSAQNRIFKLIGYDNVVHFETDGDQVGELIQSAFV